MDKRKTSKAGLASSRGTRWLREAAFGTAAIAMAFGLAAWVTDFDFAGWTNPASANVASGPSFDERFGPGSVRRSLAINYPWRPVASPERPRSNFDAEFGHIRASLGGPSPAEEEEQSVQAAPSAPPAEAAIPLPRARPVLANLQSVKSDPGTASSDNRTMFEKLADLVPMKFSLASLTPGDGLLSDRKDLAALGYDGQTAVYDISARMVYLPNGTKLEAHSGLGGLMDDPTNIHQRMVGATPPNVYDLKPREKLFHGVAALRMTPVGENEMHGRNGLLVHSYMLGPNGDSNGCVSIKEYDRFLAAYNNGEVKRLVVVPSLKEGLTASRRSPSPS
jgi:type VI secretion system (T6SS) effector TldE1-like protein